MGLFDKFKKKPPTFESHYGMTVFVAEQGLKIPYCEANKYLCGGLRLVKEDDCIRLIQKKMEIFVVSDKTKAYKKLLPFVPYDVYSVEFMKSKGKYGIYYPVRILYMLEREKGNQIAIDSLFGE